jgi:hypothetical protein
VFYLFPIPIWILCILFCSRHHLVRSVMFLKERERERESEKKRETNCPYYRCQIFQLSIYQQIKLVCMSTLLGVFLFPTFAVLLYMISSTSIVVERAFSALRIRQAYGAQLEVWRALMQLLAQLPLLSSDARMSGSGGDRTPYGWR